jgi:hypothetical protein
MRIFAQEQPKMQINKAATPSQSHPAKHHEGAWFALLLLLGKTLSSLESHIHQMRMALQSGRNCSAQICNSESAGYQPRFCPQQKSDPSPSQTQSKSADDQDQANPVAQGAVWYEIDPSGPSIIGYEIVNGRERHIWGRCHNMPWAEIKH